MSTLKQAAEHLDLSIAHVGRLVRAGVMPVPEEGKGYDLDQCRVMYIRSLRNSGSGRKHPKRGEWIMDETEGGGEELNYHVLLKKEQWREKKRENDMQDGLLVSMEVLRALVKKIVGAIRPKLESLHLQVKRVCPELSADATEVIQRAVAKAAGEMAEVYGVISADEHN
jgi:phage terminase Nu1 subunit (DNA packaging protein)